MQNSKLRHVTLSTQMEMETMIFKWTRALSQEGFTSTNLYFSQLHKSSYYVGRIKRPHYIAVISNYNAINEFSLATSTFDMSFAAWLVLFIYKGHGSDYCYSPPSNIFHLKFNSKMLVRCGMENNLREWYSIDTNRTEIVDLVTWSLEKGITKIASDSLLHERRYNLEGLIMKAVTIKDSSFLIVNEDGELDGIFGKILRELSITLNFSFNIVSEVEEYGSWNLKEKTWSGAVGELYAGRADISISDFSITSARLNAVDFTLPLLLSKKCLYIREPEIFAIKWSSFFLTFSYSIWIAILVILIVGSILLIFLKIQNGTDRNVGHLLSDNFLEIWGIFCQQGLADFSDRSSLRIAYFSILLSAVVLSAAYSAALISFLTSTVHILPFRSLESFAEDGTYQLSVFRGTSDYDMFVNSKNPLEKKLMKLMIEEEKLTTNVEEGFKRVCKNRKLAMYSSEEVQKIVNLKIPCNLASIETGRVDSLAMILSKNNPFTDVINFHLQKFIDNGMMNRLKDSTFKKKSSDLKKHEPVRINNVMSLIFFIQTEMEMTTMVFKWTCALSRKGFMTSNLYFSELHESSYYINRIVRPHYVAVISNYNAINEFSLATSNFDMSFAAWLVLFIHKANDYDYCYSPQGNIFHLKFNSEMLVRCGTENILREWYSIDPNRTEIDDVATWSLEKGIINISPNSFYERRYNLQGLIMRAIIIRNSLFIRINKDGKLYGQFDRILEELIGMLNFTFDIVAELDEYGSWNPKKKSWSGAVGELYAGHADICLSGFSMTSARLNVVDFTLPLLTLKNYLYIKKPQLFAINWSSYFLAFSNFVWIAMFGILIFASILLALFKIRYEKDRNIGYLLIDNFLEIWGIFCQQGLVDFPERSSLKIAYLSIFFLAVVLSAAYSAALISFLTSDVTILPFHSLEGFIADGTYQLIVLRGTADYDLFVNSGDPLGKKLRKFMLKDEELPINIIEGVRMICENPKLAFYSSDEINQIVNFKIPCDMLPIETGRMDNLAMILSKNNPFREVINFHLQKFINNGMMNHLKETTSKMKSFGMIKHQPVCIINVMSLIFFILIGIILSTCILIMEKLFFAHESKKNSMVERMPLKKLDFYVKRKKCIKNITNYYTNRKCSSVKY
ncbi:uncharacterized protein LOC124949128 [Vespa velutina]|uniref:uncharacterized protein LOC124949128 n=1 Tax=Vespa velutina TaxID=202808 RepID=UPI001FB20B44|nr:uncharacterized protein LOC124949128 [Vespa velutina]